MTMKSRDQSVGNRSNALMQNEMEFYFAKLNIEQCCDAF